MIDKFAKNAADKAQILTTSKEANKAYQQGYIAGVNDTVQVAKNSFEQLADNPICGKTERDIFKMCAVMLRNLLEDESATIKRQVSKNN